MNSKIYGAMVKNRSTTPSTKLYLLPVICHSIYHDIDIFCDFMRRKEGYINPDYSKRKTFIRESNLRILVKTSPNGTTYFLEEIEKHPQDTFENMHFQEVSGKGERKQHDMLPLGVVSGNLKEANALYLAILPPAKYENHATSLWLTPDEIMEKVKEGVWLPTQVKTITYLMNTLLTLPELNHLNYTQKRITW